MFAAKADEPDKATCKAHIKFCQTMTLCESPLDISEISVSGCCDRTIKIAYESSGWCFLCVGPAQHRCSVCIIHKRNSRFLRIPGITGLTYDSTDRAKHLPGFRIFKSNGRGRILISFHCHRTTGVATDSAHLDGIVCSGIRGERRMKIPGIPTVPHNIDNQGLIQGIYAAHDSTKIEAIQTAVSRSLSYLYRDRHMVFTFRNFCRSRNFSTTVYDSTHDASDCLH